MKFIDPVWLHRGYMDAETEKGLQLKSRNPLIFGATHRI